MTDITSEPNDAVEKQASRFPKEIRLAINGMASESGIPFAILSVLVEQGPLERNELSSALELDYAEIEAGLDGLQRGGLVTKQAGKRLGDPSVGAYKITTFGDQLLDAVHQASTPDTEQESS